MVIFSLVLAVEKSVMLASDRIESFGPEYSIQYYKYTDRQVGRFTSLLVLLVLGLAD